jgi:hypothetical protein
MIFTRLSHLEVNFEMKFGKGKIDYKSLQLLMLTDFSFRIHWTEKKSFHMIPLTKKGKINVSPFLFSIQAENRDFLVTFILRLYKGRIIVPNLFLVI